MKKSLALVVLLIACSGVVWMLGAESEHPLDSVYQSAGKPAAPADPETILRRMSLQLRGNIPKLDEVQNVARDPRVLDRYASEFVEDPDFARYWGTYFASVFREQTKGRKIKYASFLTYIANSLHQNKPYDVWVREMLTAQGSPDQNPAVDLYLRDGADPLQVAEYVGRVFYGERVACARCHDHPYLKFSRRDYYGLAAFFSQQFDVRTYWNPSLFDGKGVPKELAENLPDQKRKEMIQKWNEWSRETWNKMSKEEREAYKKKHEVQYATLYFNPDLGLRFPNSDDAPGGDLVAPRFPDGTVPKLKGGEDRRVIFAAWLTDAKNDRFRKVLINRVWTRLMGWSFFTPMDDWNDDTKIQGEKILNHLDQVFVQKQMRIKDLVQYIVSSNAYKRRPPQAGQGDRDSAIAYFQPQRLDPDQLMNSLVRGSGALEIKSGDLRERALTVPGQRAGIKSPEENQKEFSNAFEVPRPADDRTFLAVFGSGDRMDITDDDDTITVEQVLTLLNGRTTGRLSWDYGKKGSFISNVYDQTRDMNQVYDAVFQSTLGRRAKDSEKAGLATIASEKVGKEKGEFRPELMQDIVWGIFNSQEFLHVK
ncbi:MAG: DUF1553 domain-containing protein [Leptospirales bacterium]|nr:DUF1553 domain-containing protein [Leptospirales bacterium]